MASERGYSTPEEAALGGFDPRYARVVRTRQGTPAPHCLLEMGGNEVEVELATNEPPIEYPYFVHVERRGERWYAMQGHN